MRTFSIEETIIINARLAKMFLEHQGYESITTTEDGRRLNACFEGANTTILVCTFEGEEEAMREAQKLAKGSEDEISVLAIDLHGEGSASLHMVRGIFAA